MKKRFRILKNDEFSKLIQKRQMQKSPAFVLYTLPCKEDQARVGISVGKKLGKAVVRTRVKRQMRALIDSVYTFDEPFDSVLIVRPAFLTLSFEERKRMLEQIHKKALAKFIREEKNEKKSV